MIDRILAPALAFLMLVASNGVLIASLDRPAPAVDQQVAQGMPEATLVLEPVVITATRPGVEARTATKAPTVAAGESRGVLLHVAPR